jgi:ADP-heptose:LPS heptosyltransferase
MADTAAAIREMDLVISVCTAVAHLAATLNMPTSLMLAYASEWRWLLERTDTPWYPTMRIFRQDSRGDWPGVVTKIVATLEREGAT